MPETRDVLRSLTRAVPQAGANLFSDSLVCIDARTGKRVWHYQRPSLESD